MSGVVELRPGVQVWFEGSVWTVQEVRPQVVTIAAEAGVRTVATALLISSVTVMADADKEPTDRELVSVLLSSLTAKQRRRWKGARYTCASCSVGCRTRCSCSTGTR